MAKKYNIVTWLKAAYTQLRHVPQPFFELTDPPAVDWETIARLLYIRERHAKAMQAPSIWPAPSGTVQCLQCGSGGICCGVVNPLVEELFLAEFERMKETNFDDPAFKSVFSGKHW